MTDLDLKNQMFYPSIRTILPLYYLGERSDFFSRKGSLDVTSLTHDQTEFSTTPWKVNGHQESVCLHQNLPEKPRVSLTYYL